MSVFDTNVQTTSRDAAIRAAGFGTVIRYISTNTSSPKTIKETEARAIAAAGLKLGLVFEVWGGVNSFSHGDINAATGAQHGAFAANWARSVGAPASAVIYFAIDTDVTSAQVQTLVLPYFAAVRRAVAGHYRVGVYGCGAMCAATLDAGSADKAWLSDAMGWNGSRAFRASGRAALVQGLPKTIAGIDADPDVVAPNADIGDFVPFSSNQPTVIAHPTAQVPGRFYGITVTSFAGGSDIERSAYTSRVIDPKVPAVAMPYRFPSTATRPFVRVFNPKTGASVVCQCVDIGPWNGARVVNGKLDRSTDDPYWLKPGGRPQAETGRDLRGRKTNLAGLDMTPGGWAAIGLANAGKAKLDWEFVAPTKEDLPVTDTTAAAPAAQTPPNVLDIFTGFLSGKLQPPDLAAFQNLFNQHASTTVGAAPTSASGLPLVSIEGLVEGAESVIPIAAKFYPPLAAVVPLLPVINGGLAMLQEIQTAGNDPNAIVSVIQKHLANIGTDLEAIKGIFPTATAKT